MRSLEKERERRYETASAFAADITRHLSDEPIEARAPTALYRIRKFVARNRLVVAAATAVMGALVIGLIGTGLSLRLALQREDELNESLSFVKDYTMLLAMSGDPADESQAIEIARQTNVSPVWLNMLAARAAQARGEPGTAIRLLKDGLNIDPDHVGCKSFLSIAYIIEGDVDRHFRTREELRADRPTNAQDLGFKAMAFVTSPRESFEMISRAIEQRDSLLSSFQFAVIAVHFALDTGDRSVLPEAIRRINAVRKVAGNTPFIAQVSLLVYHAALALGLDDDSLLAQAERDVAAVLVSPEWLIGVYEVAHFLDDYGTPEESEEAWDRLMNHPNPGGFVTHAVHRFLSRPKESHRAVDALRRNDDILARVNFALWLARTGDRDATESIYDELEAEGRPVNFNRDTRLTILAEIGPLDRLEAEARECLEDCVTKEDRLIVEFLADPQHNERELLDGLRHSRHFQSMAHRKIASVRLLQSKISGANAAQFISEARAHLKQLISLRIFYLGDYYWAKAMLAKLDGGEYPVRLNDQ